MSLLRIYASRKVIYMTLVPTAALWLILLLAAGVQWSCASGSGHGSKGRADQSLTSTIKLFDAAYRNCNIDSLSAMVTKSYERTEGSATPLQKDAWLNYLNFRKKEIGDGTLVVQRYETQNPSIDYYDDVAVVTGTVISEAMHEGSHEEITYRVTEVWAREGSVWKQAAYQDVRIR